MESDEIEMGSVISQSQQERILGFLERAKGATVSRAVARIGRAASSCSRRSSPT